jgi:hypothetical protein
MTFLKRRREMLRTNKPSRIIFVLVAAVAVLSVGYIMALAILAPQQLAEATAAASDLICSGCVGTTDIADSAVTSAKIGSGQVANSDLATSAVTSAKIGSGQVANSDLATSAVTSSRISDTIGVQSVDIVNGQVSSADIADHTITGTDIADGAINILQRIVVGNEVSVPPFHAEIARANCQPGEGLTGGGFYTSSDGLKIQSSRPEDGDTWGAVARNESNDNTAYVIAYALCSGPGPV